MYISNFSKEEFGKVNNEPYIKQCLSTNLLNCFCPELEDKVKISVHIVNSLFRSSKSDFSSAFHTSWAMEFLGYAFSLPIEHHKVISAALKTYRKWILEDDRPSCININESFYQQQILGHLSLLFTERGGNILKHSKLCTRALVLMKEMTDNKSLSEDTWKTLLKILLLICNTTLTNMKTLSQRISPFLLTVLFEIWIKSNTRDDFLWKELEQNSSMWLDHIWFVNQWESVILKLTSQVVELIYGNFQPNIVIEFSGLEESQDLKIVNSLTLELEVNGETTIFLWHKFLRLMINNTKGKIPFDYKVHRLLADTIAKIIDVFLKVCDARNSYSGDLPENSENSDQLRPLIKNLNEVNRDYNKRKSRLPIPRADSILEIFGEWLFFHAGANDSYSEFGNAPAVGALCKIVCKAQGPIKQIYLNQFYQTLKNCFRDDFNQLIVGYIIRDSQSLFGLDHKGARIMAFDKKFLKTLQKIVADPICSVLKKPCCAILSTMVGLNLHLGGIKTSSRIIDIFLCLLKSKCDSDMFKRVIWGLAVFAATEGEKNSTDISKALVLHLQEVNYITERVNYNMLLGCISALPYMVESISCPEFIIEHLCKYVYKIQLKNANDSQVLHFSAILNWLICYPTCFDFPSLQKLISSSISAEITNKAIKDSAEFVLEYMQNSLLSNFSYKHFKISAGVLNSQYNFKPVKHFLFKSQFILSIFEKNFTDNGCDSILCILRSSIGKFVWSTSFKYKQKLDNQYNLPVKLCEVIRSEKLAVDADIDLPDDEMYDQYAKLFEEQSKILEGFEQKLKDRFDEGVEVKYCFSEKNSSYRMLLSQLGLFHEELLREIVVIEEDMLGTIIELDQVLEKSQMIIPIIYLQNSESMLSDPISNFSSTFLLFLNSIGILLTEEHKSIAIFSNIQEMISRYQSIIYSSDALNEILFITPCISKCNYIDLESLGDTVIVWNERANDRHSLKVPLALEEKIFNKKKIIQLMPTGNDRIKVKRFEGDAEGPLLDEMNISLEVLPKLLLRTLVNRSCSFGLRVKSMVKRRSILRRIAEGLLVNNELVRKQKVMTYSFLSE